MDRMQLLIIWCTAFICICGKNEVSSCDVTAKVKRGETKHVSPGQSLTVKCPVKHCGESFNVLWSKFSNILGNWENISDMENIRITQKDDKENLISYLRFEQVSINDDGLYRCHSGHSNEFTSHAIKISVSELNRVENPDDDDDDDDEEVDSDGVGVNRSSLSVFLIGVTIIFLIAIAIVLVLVCVQGWKQTWTCNNKNQEEKSTSMIPELLKMTVSSSPSLRTQFSDLSNIYSSSKPERTSTSLAGNVADTAANSDASNYAVLTIISYQQCGPPARQYTCKQDGTTNCCYQRLNI